MKKAYQIAFNRAVEYQFERFNGITDPWELKEVTDLHICPPTVYQTFAFIALCSRGKIVAIIDKKDMTLYDFSYYVYGFSVITAMHIACFALEFDIKPENIYTWRKVK